MNLIIIIIVGVTAYVLADLLTAIDGQVAKWQLREEEKKRLKNDLYKFKLKQLYYFCESYYVAYGYNKKDAEIMAVNAVYDMDSRNLVDEKYKLIRNENGNFRNKSRCK